MSCRIRFASFPFVLSVIFLASLLAACNTGGSRDETFRRLRQLEDREEIRELLLAYGRYLDQRNFNDFSDLFSSENGEWIGGMGSAKGREAIRKLMEEKIGANSATAAPPSFHLFSNESIEVDGDRAGATTKWIFVVQNPSGRPELFYLGHYEDLFIREDGRWKFLRRTAFSDIPGDAPAGAKQPGQ